MAVLSEELRKLILGAIGDPSSALELIAAIEGGELRSFTVDTLLSTNDSKVLANASGGDINVTLPPGEEGLEISIKNNGNANSVNILTSGGDIIDPNAGAFVTLPLGPGGFVKFLFELATTTWWVIG